MLKRTEVPSSLSAYSATQAAVHALRHAIRVAMLARRDFNASLVALKEEPAYRRRSARTTQAELDSFYAREEHLCEAQSKLLHAEARVRLAKRHVIIAACKETPP